MLAKEHSLLRMLLTLGHAAEDAGHAKSSPTEDTGDGDAEAAVQRQQLRARVLDAYGEALAAERKHEDAAVTFMAAGQLDKAMQAYRSSGQWRMLFVLARQQGLGDAEVKKLAVQVSEELASSGQPAEGAAVLLLHLGDVDNAVSMLTQAKCAREGGGRSMRLSSLPVTLPLCCLPTGSGVRPCIRPTSIVVRTW